MRRVIRAALAAFLLQSSAAAEPVALHCKIVGGSAAFRAYWGGLLVTVAEAARHVRLEGMNQPGLTFDYWDGAFAPIFTGTRGGPDVTPWVAQFVKFTPARVELGWRNQDGELEHWVWKVEILPVRTPCVFVKVPMFIL